MRRFLIWITAPPQVHGVFEPVFRLLGLRGRHAPAKLAQARRVLIVRLDHLGDIVLTSPFLREFRKNWPQAEITLLVSPEWRSLVEYCPYVDRIESHIRFRTGRLGRIRRLWREVQFTRRRLWPRKFDLAVVPRWEAHVFREAFLAYLSGARWRVGYSEEGNTIPREDESAQMLYTHLVPAGPHKHEVAKNLDLLAWMGGIVSDQRTEVWLGPEDREFAAAQLPNPAGGESAVRVALMPGSSSRSRCWPAERFAEIAAWMIRELGWQVVLVGSRSESELGAAIEQHCPPGVINLIGRATVRETAAVIERCRMYIGNDTGPKHLASALGVPVIEICCHPANGSPVHERSPVRFRAWDVPSWIARPASGLDGCRDFCAPGELGEAHCILAVTTEQVRALILQAASRCGLAPGPAD